MKKYNLMRKCSAFVIIFLFIGITAQPSFAHEASIVNEPNENDDTPKELGVGYILCRAYYVFWQARYTRPAFLVKFELTDYDTGKVIEEGTNLFGIHLFKPVQKGHDYVVKVTAPRGAEYFKINNLDSSFYRLHIGILVPA